MVEHKCNQRDKIEQLTKESALNQNNIINMTEKIDQLDVKMDKTNDKLDDIKFSLTNLQSLIYAKNTETMDKIREEIKENYADKKDIETNRNEIATTQKEVSLIKKGLWSVIYTIIGAIVLGVLDLLFNK